MTTTPRPPAEPRSPAIAEEPAPGSVPRLELTHWKAEYGLVAGITGAAGGFDLGLFGAGPAGEVLPRWLEFQGALGPAFPTLAVARQVHGTTVARHTARGGWQVLDGTDGHLTREPGVLLVVTVADCVPIYLAHPRSGTIGLLHAGWRGVAGGILETAVTAMSTDFGVTASEVVMHCGVSICGKCYEVGPEVIRAVEGRSAAGPARLDLRAALVRTAQGLGISDVSVSPWCSAHDSARFFSHRRSGGAPGRMAAYLGRPLA